MVHDRVTKYAYFIPASKTDTAEDTANKLFAQVFCLHGLPLQLISDRDRLFTAQFFAQLMRIMNVKQVMGTSYQHNFNGAAERLVLAEPHRSRSNAKARRRRTPR